MRISLGEFVSASFPVPQNPIVYQRNGVMRPGMNGLGEFVPACFSVPQNPIGQRGIGGSPLGVNGLGEFVPASFAVPQNPIYGGLQGYRGGCGGDCGCKGCSAGMEGLEGLGDAVEEITQSIGNTAKSIGDQLGLGNVSGTTLAMLGVGAVAIYFILGRKGQSEYAYEVAKAKKEFKERIGQAKQKYGRGYQRFGRATGRAVRYYQEATR